MEARAVSPDTRRLAVVVNPARSDAADDLLDRLGDPPGFEIDVARPDDPSGLAAAIAAAVADGADIVAAVGGDGTQRTAASELSGTATTLAVVPGGTVNLLGRVLGIDTIDAAADAILTGTTRSFDTGVVDGETFVLNSSSGYDAAVMRRVDDEAKRWGRLGYFVTGVRQLRDDHPRALTITIDGEEAFRGRAMSAIVTNVGQRASAEFTLASDSAPDDGQLDVVLQRCDTASSMLRAGWSLVRGNRPRPDDLVTMHGERIDVAWSSTVSSQRDGDAVGDGTTFRHQVVPGSLTVCIPSSA